MHRAPLHRLLTALLIPAAVFAADHGMLNFEDDAVLSSVTADSGKVSLSDRHHLGGKRSLRWDYRPGDTLKIAFPPWYLTDAEAKKLFGMEARTILTLNVYRETPLPGKALRVSFGRRGVEKPDCGFDLWQNFTGWRASWPVYSRDMAGKPRTDMDEIRFTIPRDAPPGTLYFDNLIPGSVTYEAYQDADLQTPNIRMNVPREKPLRTALPILTRDLRPQETHPVTDAEREGFAAIRGRLEKLLCPKPPKFFAMECRNLWKTVASFDLVRHPDGRITGKPIRFGVMDRQYTYVPEKERELAEFLPHRQFGIAMLQAAKLYRAAKPGPVRDRLLKNYFLLFDHNLDQGFAWGSGVGSRANVGYGSREFFYSLLLMRDELRKSGRAKPAADIGMWHADVKSFLAPQYYEAPNADAFNIKWRSALIAILLMDDTPEKTAYMDAFHRYLVWALRTTPGWRGGLKEDGCSYHHWGHYPSYSFGLLEGASWLCAVLHGTPWELSAEEKAPLVRTAVAFVRQGNPAMPPPLEGRVPFRGLRNTGAQNTLKLLAEIDPGLAEVAAAPSPDGFLSFNYGGFGVHRHNGKMAVLKTFNRYVWGSEIYQKQNRYGRYWSYGTLFLLGGGTAAQEGLSAAGWDWNRAPGATTRILPWKILCSPKQHFEMRTLPDNRINGCSHLENRYGAFGSVVTEPDMPHYDPKFRATTSIFVFGPRVIALGSNIASGTDFPVETTLFQLGTDRGKRPSFFNDPAPLTGSDTDRSAAPAGGKPVWCADWRGNVWFVFGDRPVHFRRAHQTSPLHTGAKSASGDFTTAVIEHGGKPKNGSYEYLLRLDLDPKDAPREAEKLASAKPYTVLRRDAAVHAVRDHASGVTAAVFFAACPELNGELLRSVKQPCYVLYRRTDDGKLRLSVNTPDLAGFIREGRSDLTEMTQDAAQEARDRTVSVTLNGVWQPVGPVPGVTVETSGDRTVVTGTFRHGIPKQLVLTHAR